jgi:hypothetical protein
LASRSGLTAAAIESVRKLVIRDAATLPSTILDWVDWLVAWLAEDHTALEELFFDSVSALAGASGRKKTDALDGKTLKLILPGLKAWMNGKPMREIEILLGGSPDDETPTHRRCPRARELVLSLAARSLSFAAGLLSSVVKEVAISEELPSLVTDEINSLSGAMRRGFDTHEKLVFASQNSAILSRVQIHKAWAARN